MDILISNTCGYNEHNKFLIKVIRNYIATFIA